MVTAARFTSLPNCSEALGEMVDTAMALCRKALATSPAMGAPSRVTLANRAGNMCWSAVILAVCARVNCQPSSEPTQAITARAMMMLPTTGLNICA
ncbi:hypothetical protein FQZ97_902630 [compost metagenome]